MKILQLSDLHLRGDGQLSFGVANTPAMLDDCITHLQTLSWRPDAIIITGDLADNGTPAAYALLKEKLAGLETLNVPLYLLPGNHDKREHLMQALPHLCPADTAPAMSPYLCYTVDCGPVRLVAFDSTRPGSHSGHFDAPVEQWLDARLTEQPERPTLLFTHHPPFVCGLGKMDEPYENSERLAALLRRFPNVRLCCGHMHRSIVTEWAGRIAVTAPSVAMQIELDLSAGGGDEFRMEAPGYLLHHWCDGVFNTHTCQIPSRPSYSGPHRFVGSVNPA